jgi:hypothetical protein
MHELWYGATGERLSLYARCSGLDEAWSAFIEMILTAKHAKRGLYLELRRPDESCYARCTMQLDASPDPGNLG